MKTRISHSPRLHPIVFLLFLLEIGPRVKCSTCQDILDPTSAFSCTQAEQAIQFNVITSCQEDLSTNPVVQQMAPGTSGMLCDVCCETCTTSIGEICPSSSLPSLTTPAPSIIPDYQNCSGDVISQFETEFTCENAMDGLQVGVISSCQENLQFNPIVQAVLPGAIGTLCDYCCESCALNQYSCSTPLPTPENATNSSSSNTTTISPSSDSSSNYECIPRLPSTLPDFCYACEFGPSPTCVSLIFAECTNACQDPTYEMFRCEDCEARVVNTSDLQLEFRLAEICNYTTTRYDHPCYSEYAEVVAPLCEAAPTCDRGFTATMCRAIDMSDPSSCPICEWSCEIPLVECSPGQYLYEEFSLFFFHTLFLLFL